MSKEQKPSESKPAEPKQAVIPERRVPEPRSENLSYINEKESEKSRK